MKLEKREITLNEKDSLSDMLLTQRTLLEEYVFSLQNMKKRETRKEILQLMQQTCEDIFFIGDLLKGTISEKEK